MLGIDEARVLVVDVVGSRSRSVRIGVELRDTPQGKSQKGDLAWSKPSNPLARTAVAHFQTGWVATGGVVRRASVGMLRERGWVKPVSQAKRCAGITPNRHRRGMMRGSVQRRKALGRAG